MIFNKKDRRTISGAGSVGIGLYGKHPCAGDFMRLNASGPEVLQLDEWLSQAMDAGTRILPDWDATFPTISQLSFLYHNPDDRGSACSLFGVMVASRDRSGRKFPLILFSYMDFGTAANCYPYLPYDAFLQNTSSLLARFMENQSISRDQLFAEAQRLRPPDQQSLTAARQAHTQYLASTSWMAAFATMFGIAAPMQQGKAVGTMRDTLGGLGQGPFPRWGIRCPLGMDPAGNAGLWLAMLYQQLQNQIVPIMFWTPRQLLLYFRKSSPKALTALISPEWQDDHLVDLSTSTKGEEHANLPGIDQPLQAILETRP